VFISSVSYKNKNVQLIAEQKPIIKNNAEVQLASAI
tara:strand:- start:2 stop:109 length:108 start_codon:yes stop_codon:yes gene_type:complete